MPPTPPHKGPECWQRVQRHAFPDAGSYPKPAADCEPDCLSQVSLARVLVQFVRN